MITEIILASGLVGAAATAITLAIQRGHDARSRAVVDAERMRLAFELETATKAFNESQRRNRILSEALNAEMARSSDLAPDDVDARRMRIEAAFAADDDISPGDRGHPLSPDPTAAASEAGSLPAEPITELR